MKSNYSRILLALFFVLSLHACGNKGDLYMPEKNKDVPAKTE
jgi:predicted small lipoprotein YifL